MSSTTKDGNEDSFESRLKKLESIVELLEHETPPLEEALKAYETGVEIARTCLKQLDEAELRVRTIRLEE